ncbi:hypothetical protein B7R54_05710 [Subtercola boreus]|uniref:Uncharacterized protein n=1 Tax=Subtercola boreus TaxID=120213 RepID=A0A3E0VIU3_9MICO|nr:hypothetical protein [Subtercola boreus]RFA08777.1 hypothetical protein B7R54_05710 [Subtercola boreus]TQL54260.1 hypothetical protein FB464_1793 [Subtercola boreus]
MEWWSNFLDWANTDGGAYVITSIAVPAVSIIVAGLLAAWIASGSIKRLLAGRDRDLKVAAIGALVDSAEQASVWNSLTPQEQVLSDRATGQADIQVRLLPIKGAAVAANWAAHSLAEMKRNSATFGYQVEPAVIVFRDQLVEWQNRPGRTRRSFQSDLDRWSQQGTDTERSLKEQQEAWVAQQHHEQHGATAAATSTAPAATAQAPAVNAPAQPASAFQAPTYPAQAVEAPRAGAGTLDTARVLSDVDAVQRHIDAPASR